MSTAVIGQHHHMSSHRGGKGFHLGGKSHKFSPGGNY